MFLIREITTLSTTEIGECFGDRTFDHGTVLHACQAVKDRMATKFGLKKDLEDFVASFKKEFERL